MSDVLISYARSDQALAEALEAALLANGFDVWRDNKISPHENFGERIMAQIEAAKAVVVIWSPASAKSDFVRDEARRALEARKLVMTVLDGYDRKIVPLGFGERQFVALSDHARIFAALESLGAKRGPQRQQEEQRRRRGFLDQSAAKAAALAAVAIAVVGAAALLIMRPTSLFGPPPSAPTASAAATPSTVASVVVSPSASVSPAAPQPSPTASVVASPSPSASPVAPQPSPTAGCAKFPLKRFEADDIGRATIQLDRSCGPLPSIRVRYVDYDFVRALRTEQGVLIADFFLFAGPSDLVLSIDGGPSQRQTVSGRPGATTIESVAIVWRDPVSLDLHMSEFGAKPGSSSAGDVYSANPHSYEQAMSGATGWMLASDDGAGPGAHLQAYGFLPGDAARAGAILATVDFKTRGDPPAPPYCGADAPEIKYELFRYGAGGPVRRAYGFKGEECGAPLKTRYVRVREGDIRVSAPN
jgi:hypothetical protein